VKNVSEGEGRKRMEKDVGFLDGSKKEWMFD
jgi:hypothetical protein